MFRESQGLFSSMSQLFLTVLDMPALDEDIDPAKTTLRRNSTVRPARSLLRPVFRGTLASLAVMACPVSLHVSGCPACGGLATRCRYTQAFWLRPVAWLLNTPPHGH